MQLPAAPALTIGEAISGFLAAQGDLFFVQVGGFDGVSFDPLRPSIASRNLSGLIIEPMPNYFAKLRELYATSGRIRVCNCAIDAEEGERRMWRFIPVAMERGLLAPEFAGISSLMMEELLKEGGSIGRLFDDKQRALLRRLVEPVTVACRRLDTVLSDHGVTRVDLLRVGTVGYDFNILRLFDFQRFHPAIVHYETRHLGAEDREQAEAMLTALGYRLHREENDTLALRGVFLSPHRADAAPVLRLASSLRREGRTEDALTLSEHVVALEPDNVEALRLSAVAFGATGRSDAALARLAKARALSPNADGMLAEIHEQAVPAIHAFNDHIRRNELEPASRIIAGLTALYPENREFLAMGFEVSSQRHQPEQVEKFAAALLALDPGHFGARMAMAQQCNTRGDVLQEIEHRVRAARLPPRDTNSVLLLKNIYDALSAILCGDLDEVKATLVEELIATARSIGPAQPSTRIEQVEAWERYYRTAIDGVDLAAILGPTPEEAPWPAIGFASSSGSPMELPQVRAVAARQRAEIVFFVAADAAYVARYARWYVSSVLRACDVPCLVVVHVIGALGRLGEAAASVGIEDSRLIFSADGFDPASVTGRCYATPNGVPTHGLAAHYQSARFQWLGYLLRQLALPIIVSDIDLLLQRGVKDLLERCADADIVFNELTVKTELGSRLVANLLLVNPTGAGEILARYLRFYLETQLRKEKIDRFIDQTALLMARHHVLRAAAPRLAYFDKFDVNNLVYKQYHDNPYRFFSMYLGFDVSTLAPVAGQSRAGELSEVA